MHIRALEILFSERKLSTNKISRSAFSVQQFCDDHDISRNLFYRMLAEGTGPVIMKLGRRTLISSEAAAAWRMEIEERSTREMAVRAAQTIAWTTGGDE